MGLYKLLNPLLSHLHKECVLVAVELQEVVVQLGGDAFCISAIQVTKQK
jgi:hypothetical protein